MIINKKTKLLNNNISLSKYVLLFIKKQNKKQNDKY